jgi:glycosyltransferase involved in cell wall biosynthesis
LLLVALQAGIWLVQLSQRGSGLPEIVLHHESGLLVEKENSRAWPMPSLLLTHPAAAVQMGKQARRVQTLFDWRRHVDAYDALYRQLGKR